MRPESADRKNRKGVLICGAYGMGNAGDEAILGAILGEMREIDPDMPITVLSRSPKETEARYNVRSLHMFDVPGFLGEMKRKKLYINGGGSLIQDATSSRSLYYYLFTLRAAHALGCKVLMYGCGIGPVSGEKNRQLAGKVIDSCVDEITLREDSSLRELQSFGVKRPKITLASDPALSLKRAPDPEVDAQMLALGLEPRGKYICFCLRDWEGFSERAELFASAADYAFSRCGLEPVFLSANHRNDSAAAEKAARHMTAPYKIIADPMPAPLTLGVISRMQALVAIRLHGLIFAASQAVPVAGISYDPKVAAFLDYIGQKNYLPLSSLAPGRLEGLIDTALSSDRAALAENVERLRAVERRSMDAARALLEG